MSRFASIDDLLADARSRLHRLTPRQASEAIADGWRLVDIRPMWQRERDGQIPGAYVIERNHLEWRLHPDSSARLPEATPDARWIVYCTEGYTSSLAADALNSLGIEATDIDGGYYAWRDAGLPTGPGGGLPDEPPGGLHT